MFLAPPRAVAEILEGAWRAMTDSDGHYVFAVALL